MGTKKPILSYGGIIVFGSAVFLHSMQIENHDWAADINPQHTHHENRNPLDSTLRLTRFTLPATDSMVAATEINFEF